MIRLDCVNAQEWETKKMCELVFEGKPTISITAVEVVDPYLEKERGLVYISSRDFDFYAPYPFPRFAKIKYIKKMKYIEIVESFYTFGKECIKYKVIKKTH